MWDILKNFPVVTSIITATISAFLGYFYYQRNKKAEQFQNQVNENIRDVCSPIFIFLRKINRSQDFYTKQSQLKEFFEKYSSPDSKIYKLGNGIVEKYFELDDLFYTCNTEKYDEDRWLDFWCMYHNFYKTIVDEYWNNLYVVYGNFKWDRFIQQKNIYLRIYYNIIRLLYDTSVFSVLACSVALYFAILNALDSNKIFSDKYLFYIALGWFFSIMFFGFMMMLGNHYLALTINKNSTSSKLKLIISKSLCKVMKKILNKLVPKLVNKYDTWISSEKIKKKGKYKIYLPNKIYDGINDENKEG